MGGQGRAAFPTTNSRTAANQSVDLSMAMEFRGRIVTGAEIFRPMDKVICFVLLSLLIGFNNASELKLYNTIRFCLELRDKPVSFVVTDSNRIM